MKLYTEEQVRQSLIKHQNAAMLLSIEQIDYLIEEITPIELPSDDEIDEKINNDIFIESDEDFFNGAIWMRSKIQGGNK